MTRPSWEVLVLPATGQGRSYRETVEAQNATQAKQLVKSRIPDDWKVGNSVRRV